MRFAKEPLVQFLLCGALLFVAFAVIPRRAAPDARNVRVTRERVESLASTFVSTHGRQPDKDELQQLVDGYVREEICCREAATHGFDRDDPVIRNELIHNLQVIPDEMVAQQEPSDADLGAFLHEHPELFSNDRRYTFSQIYLNVEYHRGTLKADAARLIATLNRDGSGADPTALADPIALDAAFANTPSAEVVKRFGEDFTRRLAQVSVGQWCGPFSSSVGQHLLLVQERTEGRLMSLQDERGYLRAEWLNARRVLAREEFYHGLRRQYTVTVEQSHPVERREAREAAVR